MLKVVGASWSQIRLSTWIIGIVIALGIVAIVITETGKENDDGNYSATVYWSDELGYVTDFWGQGTVFEEIPKGVARAHYDPHIQETGWAILKVETQEQYLDHVQAFAAGLLEGALTWQMIYWHWQNTISPYCEQQTHLCNSIRHYLSVNYEWVKTTANENMEDPYWHQIFLFYVQLEGIETGFKQGVERSRQEIEEIPIIDFIWMNTLGDFPDLEQKFLSNPYSIRKRHLMPKNRFTDATKFDCGYKEIPLSSAFVKFLPEKDKLFVAHNSAGPYNQMLKMFKQYEFRYHQVQSQEAPIVYGTKLVFSSYPAAIHSMDDFYIVSGNSGHNLVIAATPITIFDNRVWRYATSKDQVLVGPRAITASRLAPDPQIWTEQFTKYNSGTGNKAWFIVNMGLFEQATTEKSKKYLPENLKNLFWVLEQIPGTIKSSEETETLLGRSYWAGYGIPYEKVIFKLSGTEAMEAEHGSTFSYNKTALANIFRRDQNNVTDLDSAFKLMRSNLYKVDPYSEGNPRCAVGSRGDVKGIDAPEPVGVTDIKVMSSRPRPVPVKALRNNTLRIQVDRPRLLISAGPAYGGITTAEDTDDLAPFTWSDGDFPNITHIGQPDKWMFDPIPIHIRSYN